MAEKEKFLLKALQNLLHYVGKGKAFGKDVFYQPKKKMMKPKKKVITKTKVVYRTKKEPPKRPRTNKDLFFVSSRNPLPPLTDKTLMGG